MFRGYYKKAKNNNTQSICEFGYNVYSVADIVGCIFI